MEWVIFCMFLGAREREGERQRDANRGRGGGGIVKNRQTNCRVMQKGKAKRTKATTTKTTTIKRTTTKADAVAVICAAHRTTMGGKQQQQ